MRKKTEHAGFAWVEVFVIIAILLIVGSLFVRVWYGQAWLAAEYSFVESLGISRSVYDTSKIALLCIAVLCYAIYRIARVRRSR